MRTVCKHRAPQKWRRNKEDKWHPAAELVFKIR